MLGDVLVVGDIEVLEHWLDVNSLNADSLSVLSKDASDHGLLLLIEVHVLASGKDGVVVGDWSNVGIWILLDSVGGESRVDVGAEVLVANEVLWISSLVLDGKRV